MTEESKREVVNQWITDNYKQLRINIVFKLAGDTNPLADDLLASTIEQFLLKDIDTQYRIVTEEKPEYYITRMAALNLKSSTSHFYSKYRKPTMMIREYHVNKSYHGEDIDYELDDIMEDDIFKDVNLKHKYVRKALKLLDEHNLYYYDLIQKLYLSDWSHQDYSDHYGIPMHELRANVTAARNKFKQYYKKLERGHIK